MVSSTIRLTMSQGYIQLPSRLGQVITEAQEAIDGLPEDMISVEAAQQYLRERGSDISLQVQTNDALTAASIYMHLRLSEGVVRAAATYAVRQARVLAEEGEVSEGLSLLNEAAQLLHDFIPMADPRQTRIFVDQLSDVLCDAFTLHALVGAPEFLEAIPRLEKLLHRAQTMWEPVFRESLTATTELLPTLLGVGRMVEDISADTVDLMQSILERLTEIRDQVRDVSQRVRGKKRVYANSLILLLEAWQQIIQQQIVLLAKVREEKSASMDHHQVQRRVGELIAKVERNLRVLIARKYEEQYGEGWVKHIQSKHDRMYDYWMHNLRKDKAAFQLYQEYAPSILEYARFDDLLELVAAQWHLFRDILDFGYDKRNKAVFQDKMQRIATIRNPLAHQRSVPENELLRALVLCNDILKALEAARND